MTTTARTDSISVLMTTYNGARFLREQLASIAAQTFLPAELVVCDDGSTDDTLAILDEFSRAAPFPVRIHKNPTRLGYSDNFLNGSTLTTGRLIAFSDQDDVWNPAKLAHCVRAFEVEGTVLAIHTAEIVDAGLNLSGQRKPDFAADALLPRHGCELAMSLPGFAMVFDAQLLRAVDWRRRPRDEMNDERPLMAHDQWVLFLARSCGLVAQIAAPLAFYRQHGANTCGASLTPWENSGATLQRDINRHAYDRRAHASASYRDFLATLATEAPAGWRDAFAASSADYGFQCDAYARRSALYAPATTLSRRIGTYAGLLNKRAYRRGVLGHRALIKDACAVLWTQ